MKEAISKFALTIFTVWAVYSSGYSQKVDSISTQNYIPITFEVTNQTFSRFNTVVKMPGLTSMMVNKPSKLPLFCDIEQRMEVKSNIPVRFRIGNLDYVNKLEGKD